MEVECAFAEGVLKSCDKLAAKTRLSTRMGRKNVAAGRDPAGVVWSETASGDYAVYMGVMLQVVGPRYGAC